MLRSVEDLIDLAHKQTAPDKAAFVKQAFKPDVDVEALGNNMGIVEVLAKANCKYPITSRKILCLTKMLHKARKRSALSRRRAEYSIANSKKNTTLVLF